MEPRPDPDAGRCEERNVHFWAAKDAKADWAPWLCSEPLLDPRGRTASSEAAPPPGLDMRFSRDWRNVALKLLEDSRRDLKGWGNVGQALPFCPDESAIGIFGGV